jgi:hypothetical protein
LQRSRTTTARTKVRPEPLRRLIPNSTHPRLGACTRRIAPASSGTEASRLAAGRVDHAAWCMPSPRAR